MTTPTAHADHVSAQCPSCGLHELVPVFLEQRSDGKGWQTVEAASAQSVQIDACPLCNGAWFDSGELDLLAGEQAKVENSLEGGEQRSSP